MGVADNAVREHTLLRDSTTSVALKFSLWIANQELPLIIGLIVLMFVSWDLYPLLAR